MQESEELTREREARKAQRKAFSEKVNEARTEVEMAIDALEAQPRSYGGHLAKDATSTIDGSWSDATIALFDQGWRRTDRFEAGQEVVHRDGRTLRFERYLDPADTPYLTALVTADGEVWRVVPAHKLRRAA